MDGKRGISLSVPSTRPSITLPARSTTENMFAGGGTTTGESPGPMTLVSNFFSENDPDSDCRSFSQLLSGAMMSPAEIPERRPESDAGLRHSYENKLVVNGGSGGGGSVDFQFSGNNGRPTSLVVSQPAMFTIPPGMSPASLLDSPGFFPQIQGSLGLSHQQALPQVTAQAAQVHNQTHTQLPQIHSFNSNVTTYQRLPASIADHNTAKESSNLSNADNRYQPSATVVDKPADDGYNWRKYGQKQVKGSEYPRSYYKCTNPNCPVKKQVERSVEGQVTEIIYKGKHNHQPPQSKRGKDNNNNNGTSSQYEQGFEGQTSNYSHSMDGRSMHSLPVKDQESSQATYEHSGSSDGEEVGDDVSRGDERYEDGPQPKRRNTEVRGSDPVSSHRTVAEPRIIVQTTSEVDLLDDGYRWRKYGQKVVKGNPHPRSYYKCTTPGCNVRKHVERAASDPKAVITTYEGKHTHDVPAAKNSSHNMANAIAQPPNHAPTGAHSLTRIPEYPNRQQPPPTGLLQFKEEQFT
uniref:probable WRKY transcription factor 4 isoform X2 n=1 Tax=Erigeron canadensis TaxID=72917 RepID=UPI001CB9777B|nr:probable WRKY transcription factor 4 isoform X2 [Erigeron canadensis]